MIGTKIGEDRTLKEATIVMNDLIERLENLRINDSSFFNVTPKIQFAYEKANDMLDECLQVIYDYFQECGNK